MTIKNFNFFYTLSYLFLRPTSPIKRFCVRGKYCVQSAEIVRKPFSVILSVERLY